MNDSQPTPPPQPQPIRLRSAPRPSFGAMVLTLLAGAMIGAGLMVLLRPGPPPRARRSIAELRDRLTAEFVDRLDLNEHQQEMVRAILEERLTAVRRIQQKIRPEMNDQAVLLNAQLYEILDYDQRAKWREFYAQLRRRWFGPETATRPAKE